jgi:ATP-GRASP peptide maturase of grasp-with-spasm system
MIFIFSEPYDITTSVVCKWLNYFQQPFLRINASEPADINITDGAIAFQYAGARYDLDQCSAYWYRRGGFLLERFQEIIRLRQSKRTLPEAFFKYLIGEFRSLEEYFFHALQRKKGLDSFFRADVNKLIVLRLAREHGLQTPFYLIRSQADERLLQHLDNQQFITKSIANVLHFFNGRRIVKLFTNRLDAIEPGDRFMYTLFQTEIPKLFELRIFYLKGAFYAMAIFSQNDDQTAVDFRHYNQQRPNRTVPFNLPVIIEQQLSALIRHLQLDTCSVDMIYGADHAYYFLEINPVGQFGMVSFPCNYYLEQKIAQTLCRLSSEN